MVTLNLKPWKAEKDRGSLNNTAVGDKNASISGDTPPKPNQNDHQQHVLFASALLGGKKARGEENAFPVWY